MMYHRRFWLYASTLCGLATYRQGCEFDPELGQLTSWDGMRRDVFQLDPRTIQMLHLIANPPPVVVDCTVNEEQA